MNMKTTHSIALLLSALVVASQAAAQSVVILGNYPPNPALEGSYPIGLSNNKFYEKAISFVTLSNPIRVTSVTIQFGHYLAGGAPRVGFYTGGTSSSNLVGALLENPAPGGMVKQDCTFTGTVSLAPNKVYVLKISAAEGLSKFSVIVGGPPPARTDFAVHGFTYNSGDHGQTWSEVLPTTPYEIRGIVLPIPGPPLNVSPETNGVTLSWASPSTGYVLQENPDLNTTNWTDVAEVPADNGTILSVTITPQGASRFYRLSK